MKDRSSKRCKKCGRRDHMEDNWEWHNHILAQEGWVLKGEKVYCPSCAARISKGK